MGGRPAGKALTLAVLFVPLAGVSGQVLQTQQPPEPIGSPLAQRPFGRRTVQTLTTTIDCHRTAIALLKT
jgi:hypothetical protein